MVTGRVCLLEGIYQILNNSKIWYHIYNYSETFADIFVKDLEIWQNEDEEKTGCQWDECLYELSYRKLFWNLEIVRYDFKVVWSLWNLTGTSAALLQSAWHISEC